MEVVSIYLYFTLYFYFINTTKVNKYFYCTISNTFNAPDMTILVFSSNEEM